MKGNLKDPSEGEKAAKQEKINKAKKIALQTISIFGIFFLVIKQSIKEGKVRDDVKMKNIIQPDSVPKSDLK